MTTIACDGRTVAADGQMQDNGAFAPISDWIADGADIEKLPKIGEFSVIEFGPEQAFAYSHDIPYPDPYNYPCAFGSGQPFALAAMQLGKGAVDAVRVAMELDPGSGGEVTRISLEPASDVQGLAWTKSA